MIDKTLVWLYSAECDNGGISAWNDGGKWHNGYLEVTGYLLPTLIHYGAHDLALRCADWLISNQNNDGSWNGLDGVKRPFDTAAIIEGLTAMFETFNVPRHSYAVQKAVEWMQTQISPEGYLYNSPSQHTPEIYNLRASAIIGNKAELEYWQTRGLNQREARAHYVAYALEGALNLDPANKWAREQIEMAHSQQTGLIPFYICPDWGANHPSLDYCASAQMGILYQRIGLDAGKVYKLLKGVVTNNGGIPQADGDGREIAWGAKFWLDFKKVMQ